MFRRMSLGRVLLGRGPEPQLGLPQPQHTVRAGAPTPAQLRRTLCSVPPNLDRRDAV